MCVCVLETTESLKETESKRAESLREILEKTKSELNEVKEHEAELLSKAASLEVRLESMTQQEEHLKVSNFLLQRILKFNELLMLYNFEFT